MSHRALFSKNEPAAGTQGSSSHLGPWKGSHEQLAHVHTRNAGSGSGAATERLNGSAAHSDKMPSTVPTVRELVTGLMYFSRGMKAAMARVAFDCTRTTSASRRRSLGVLTSLLEAEKEADGNVAAVKEEVVDPRIALRASRTYVEAASMESASIEAALGVP